MTERFDAQAAPMTEFKDQLRTHEQACKEDGHLLADDNEGGKYCMRCPHTE